MKASFASFVSAADLHAVGAGRSKTLAAAVAVAMTSSLSLPTSPVESAVAYFDQYVLPQARRVLATFNEEVVLGMGAGVSFVRAIWLIRYSAAFPTQLSPLSGRDGSFFDVLLGVQSFFSPEEEAFLNTNKASVFLLASAARAALAAEADANTPVTTIAPAEVVTVDAPLEPVGDVSADLAAAV